MSTKGLLRLAEMGTLGSGALSVYLTAQVGISGGTFCVVDDDFSFRLIARSSSACALPSVPA